MEKIQQALARARQARGEVEAAGGAAGGMGGSGPVVRGLPLSQTVPVGVQAAWEALPEARDPADARARRGRVLSTVVEGGGTAFDIMRTRLLQVMQQAGWRRLGITSPTAACGKTTITANLGLGLVRQSDLRVMLVDFDLRRPALGSVLGVEPVESLSPMLEGTAGPEAVFRRLGPRLAVACGQRAVAGASDLLRAPRTGEVLAAIEASFEPTLTIFDLPPVLVGDDVMSFAPHLDAVLILARAGVSTIKEIDRCERDLAAQTNVLGVVLNQCEFASSEEYGYQSYYSYGQGQS